MEEKWPEKQDLPAAEAALRQGFLELVYGVLFEPRRALAGVAARPPLTTSILLFSLVSLAGAVMNALVSVHLFRYHPLGIHWFLPAAPFMAAAAFLFQYLKWMLTSALIHLVAGLLGGQGKAAGVLCVTALASLPALWLVPVDFLLLALGARGAVFMAVTAFLGLAAFLWGVGLVVLGTSFVYGLSLSRALLAVILPPLLLAGGGFVLLLLLMLHLSA